MMALLALLFSMGSGDRGLYLGDHSFLCLSTARVAWEGCSLGFERLIVQKGVTFESYKGSLVSRTIRP